MQTRRRLVVALLLIAIAILVGWVHRPVLGATTIWLDDESYVITNPLVLNPSWRSAETFLSEVQHPSTVSGYYQPLTMISLMLDSAAGGRRDHLQPFRETSLALHILNTLLVVVLFMLLFREPFAAAMVGLLFGLHPLTVEPVSWIAERKTLLAACFTLGALIAYVRYAEPSALDRADASGRPQPGRLCPWPRRSWYAGSLACYALALLSKPTSTPLPILMLLLDYWPLRRLHPRAVAEKIPFFVLGAMAAAVTVFSQQSAGTIAYPGEQSPQTILLTVCHNIVFYLWKMIWPAHLSAYYLYPEPMSVWSPMVLAGVIGTCVLVVCISVSLRWTRALFTGWLFFLVALSPTVGVIRFTTPSASEKYAYLPAVGVMMVLAWLLARCWSLARKWGTSGRVVQAAIGVVVLALAAEEAGATRRYLTIWHDDESLYGYVLSHSPEAWWLQYDFGKILAGQGRMQEAVGHYARAEAGEPSDLDIQLHLGNALYSLGRADEAVGHYERILEQQPTDTTTMYNLGVAFVPLGRLDEAVTMFRNVLRSDPNNASANNELGVALAKQGSPEQAVASYRAAVQLNPEFFEAHVNLADTLQAIGQLDEAITQYQLALHLDPNDPAVHNNLGAAFTEKGMVDAAIAQFRAALHLSPDLSEAQINLRAALAQQDAARTARP